MNHRIRLKELLQKLEDGGISAQELADLESLVSNDPEFEATELIRSYLDKQTARSAAPGNENPDYWTKITEAVMAADNRRIKEPAANQSILRFFPSVWLRVAAMILILAGGVYLWQLYNTSSQPAQQPIAKEKPISPASHKAILTLEDGSTIVLDSDSIKTIQHGPTTVSLQNGELLVHILSTLRTYDEYSRILPEINRYVLTSDQKSRALESVAKLAKTVTKPGYPALDFQYPDVDNNMISLSQFKGKVVLVDVWATWCAPCKAEIPALKKLEKEMHGKNVVFMSVSVDEERDRQKWKDFVKKEQLGGVQLFASGWSAITKLYDIKGIPRFMLFDQAGNIVSIDSPRPSNPKLKEIIDGLLSNTQAGN